MVEGGVPTHDCSLVKLQPMKNNGFGFISLAYRDCTVHRTAGKNAAIIVTKLEHGNSSFMLECNVEKKI